MYVQIFSFESRHIFKTAKCAILLYFIFYQFISFRIIFQYLIRIYFQNFLFFSNSSPYYSPQRNSLVQRSLQDA